MKLKKILYAIFWIMVIVGIGFLIFYSFKSQRRIRCEKYTINIDIESGDTLLYPSDIEKTLSISANPFVGKKLLKINLSRIEKEIKKDVYVTNAEIFSNLQGDIFMNIRQFTPVVRVITTDLKNFYLDKYGNMAPCNRPAHVKIANGNFLMNEEQTFTDLLRCVQLIQSDAFFDAQIGQIYVTEEGIYKLYPVVGKHEIILGRPNNFEKGLQKLKLFYAKGIDGQGWEDYKSIDVRFKDQVVCAKR